MARPESALERRLRLWVESQGWQCRKLVDVGRPGFPDRTIIGPDWVAFVELKRPDGKGVVSDGQDVTRLILEHLGHHVLTSHNLEEIKRWLLAIDLERNPF